MKITNWHQPPNNFHFPGLRRTRRFRALVDVRAQEGRSGGKDISWFKAVRWSQSDSLSFGGKIYELDYSGVEYEPLSNRFMRHCYRIIIRRTETWDVRCCRIYRPSLVYTLLIRLNLMARRDSICDWLMFWSEDFLGWLWERVWLYFNNFVPTGSYIVWPN